MDSSGRSLMELDSPPSSSVCRVGTPLEVEEEPQGQTLTTGTAPSGPAVSRTPAEDWRDWSHPCWRVLESFNLSKEVAKQVPTYRTVPATCRQAFADLTQKVFEQVVAAHASGDRRLQ
eukprot:4369597-Prorocentrum_lima.AAC.1